MRTVFFLPPNLAAPPLRVRCLRCATRARVPSDQHQPFGMRHVWLSAASLLPLADAAPLHASGGSSLLPAAKPMRRHDSASLAVLAGYGTGLNESNSLVARPLVNPLEMLQADYSVAVYGAKARVDTASLKIVWFGLLQPHERDFIMNSSGVCGNRSPNRYLCGNGPQRQPWRLFAPMGIPNGLFGDPHGAMWVDNPGPDVHVPSDAWVEVTHCPLTEAARARHSFLGQDPNALPAWAFVAPGSGVSINVGKTAVIREQAAFLAGYTRLDVSKAMSVLITKEQRLQSKLLRWLGLSMDEIAQLDSVQRIGHQETWSSQQAHEIVFFHEGLREVANLRQAATANPKADQALVMCGKYPNLFRCTETSAALGFMEHCNVGCEYPLPCHRMMPCVPHSTGTDSVPERGLKTVTTVGLDTWSQRDVLNCGIPELRYSVRVSDHRVMQPKPVWVPRNWPSPANTPLQDIFWVHIPKTATEFARTLLTYACGPTSFDAERDVSTAGGIRQPATGCSRLSSLQHQVPHSNLGGPGVGTGSASDPVWFHEWVPWKENKTLAKSVVSIFRDPVQRAISSIEYFYDNARSDADPCCGAGWGWSKEIRTTLRQRSQEWGAPYVMSSFTEMAPPQNCMTNMLMGHGCLSKDEQVWKKVSSPEGQRRVIDFVSRGMAFVGILERYDETVCLWHARFGEPLWSTEIKLRQDLHVHDSSKYTTLLKLSSNRESLDERVYQAALKRFDEEVKTHQDAIDECVASIQKHRKWPKGRDARTDAGPSQIPFDGADKDA